MSKAFFDFVWNDQGGDCLGLSRLNFQNRSGSY